MSPERLALLDAFLNGLIVMGHGTAGLFFVRFWRRSKDRLFVLFAIAFWLLGAIHAALAVFSQTGEDHFLYAFRLAAYLIILAAIVDKNLRK